MQVFVGNSGPKKILGVTKASQNQWDANQSDSIFHSSLPYLQLEEFRLTNWSWLVLGPNDLYARTNYYVEQGVPYPQIRKASTLNSSGGSTQPGSDKWNWDQYWYDQVQFQFQKFVLPDYAKNLLAQRTPYFLVYKWSDGYTQMVQPRQGLIPVDSNEGYFGYTPTSTAELISTGLDEYSQQLNLSRSQQYLLVGERRPSYDRGPYGTTTPARTLSELLVTEVCLYFTKNMTMDSQGNLGFTPVNAQETSPILVTNSQLQVAGSDITNNKYFAVHSTKLTFEDKQYTNDVQVCNLFQGGITQPSGEVLKHHSFYGYPWCDEYDVGLLYQSTAKANTLPIPTSRMFQFQPQYGKIPIACEGYNQEKVGAQGSAPLWPNTTSRIIFPTELGGRYLSLGVQYNANTIYTKRDFLTDRKYTELSNTQRAPLVTVLHGKSEQPGVTFSSMGGQQGIRINNKSLFQENTKLFCKVGATYRLRVPCSYFTPQGTTNGTSYQGVRKQFVQAIYLTQQEQATNTFLTQILPLTQYDYSLQIKQQGWRGHVWNYVAYQLQPFQINWSSYNGSGYSGWYKSSTLDQFTGGQMPVPVDDSQQVFTSQEQSGTAINGQGAQLGVIDLPVGYSYIMNWELTNSFRTYTQQTPLQSNHVCKGTQGQHLVLERVSATEIHTYLIDYNSPDCYIEQYLNSGSAKAFWPTLQHGTNIFNVQLQPLY